MGEYHHRPSVIAGWWGEEGRILDGGNLNVMEDTGEEPMKSISLCVLCISARLRTHEMKSANLFPAPKNLP